MSIEKPLRRQGILSKGLGNEIVIYDKDGKTIHVLNCTAHTIWELCDGSHTLPEMEQIIRARFAIPDGKDDVAADIQCVLTEFAKKGLIVNS